MGKFFNGRVSTNRGSLIKYGIIGGSILIIIILFVIIGCNKDKDNSNANLELHKTIDIEINSDWPDKLDFFSKFENYNVDLVSLEFGDDFSTTEVGSYKVLVHISEDQSEEVTVNIKDTIAPVIVVHDYEIAKGETYEVQDFVESCFDNSEKDCLVAYDTTSLDQNGNLIDYSSFTEENTYTIKLIAKDETGNATEVQKVTLKIGEGTNPDDPVTPTDCSFGDLSVDETQYNYPVAVIVGDESTGCALNRDLWDNDISQVAVNDFYNQDYARLKTQMTTILETNFPNGAKIVAYPHYIAILNKDLKGLVGYAIYVKVYVVDASSEGQVDAESNLKIAYYLKSDKSRQYTVNSYNLGV